MNANSSRRDLLKSTAATAMVAGLAAVAVPAVPVAALVIGTDPNADAELLELGRRFEVAFARWLAMTDRSHAEHAAFEEAFTRATGMSLADRPDRYIAGVKQPDPLGWWPKREEMMDQWPWSISDEQWDEVGDPVLAAVHKIAEYLLDHDPVTLAGLSLLARVEMFNNFELWLGDNSGNDPEELEADQMSLRSLIEAVLKFTSAPPPMTPAPGVVA